MALRTPSPTRAFASASRYFPTVYIDLLWLAADAKDEGLEVGIRAGHLAVDRPGRNEEEIAGPSRVGQTLAALAVEAAAIMPQTGSTTRTLDERALPARSTRLEVKTDRTMPLRHRTATSEERR